MLHQKKKPSLLESAAAGSWAFQFPLSAGPEINRKNSEELQMG
jgi:hypothetical protein